jgi:hypothetical protein
MLMRLRQRLHTDSLKKELMMEDTRKALIDLVSNVSGHSNPIEDLMCLYHDLRISGDDAWELLETIQKKFGTQFDGFEFTNYFPSEPDAIFHHMQKLFGSKDSFKRFPVGHLVRVVKAGHWLEPDPRPAEASKGA